MERKFPCSVTFRTEWNINGTDFPFRLPNGTINGTDLIYVVYNGTVNGNTSSVPFSSVIPFTIAQICYCLIAEEGETAIVLLAFLPFLRSLPLPPTATSNQP